MPSFNVVNYSLRPSKSIQRQVVFEGVRNLQSRLDAEDQMYVGFGSIWFTDFILAHKMLGIRDMVSMEKSDVGYSRARFNSPYATVEVRHGSSEDILPALLDEEHARARPWVVWLDYDREFDEALREDCRRIIERAPANSVFLATFSGNERLYGRARDRIERLRAVFLDVVPDDLTRAQCSGTQLQETLANFALDVMTSVAADTMRQGGFVPAFRVLYKDGAPMVTVGGVLPSRDNLAKARDEVSGDDWHCQPPDPIIAPHLTVKEAIALQSRLPSPEHLSREVVQSLGFDLEKEQIEVFERYYLAYPTYAQVVA